MMIEVHHFRTYVPLDDDWYLHPLKATVEEIERAGGVIVPGTAQEVLLSSLNEKLRYDPYA